MSSKDNFPYFDLESFSNDFREVVKSRNLTAQAVSDQTHVARPTITKIMSSSRRHMCDAPTLAILAFWARLRIESYVAWPDEKAVQGQDGEEAIVDAIHKDSCLNNKSKNALVRAFRAMYKALK